MMTKFELEGRGGDVAASPDWLDTLLRDAARRESCVDDAGFTARVLARIPSTAPSAMRRWILWGFGTLACLLGLGVLGGGAFIWHAALAVASQWSFGAPQLAVLAVAALFYWFVLSSIDRRELR
jgi:hypothetical protein